MIEPEQFDDPACRSHHLGQQPWFPPATLGSADPFRGWLVIEAKRICAGCKHVDDCADWASAQGAELHGVWGGLTANDRRDVRRARRVRRAS